MPILTQPSEEQFVSHILNVPNRKQLLTKLLEILSINGGIYTDFNLNCTRDELARASGVARATR